MPKVMPVSFDPKQLHYSVQTSLFDLYKVGIGPSSSHTMGPMRAARTFAQSLADSGLLDLTSRVCADLYGSLALTGLGHGTDRAVLLGLSGQDAATIDPGTINSKLATIRNSRTLPLHRVRFIPFDESTDLVLHRDQMFPPGAVTQHPNGMRFTAYTISGKVLSIATWFSIGGGFIVADGEEITPAVRAVNSPGPDF